MHFSVFCAWLVISQTANGKCSWLFLMTYTACMFPKRDRADMKLLNIINGTNCEFSFLCNCKADNQNKNNWDIKPFTNNLYKLWRSVYFFFLNYHIDLVTSCHVYKNFEYTEYKKSSPQTPFTRTSIIHNHTISLVTLGWISFPS